MGEHSDFADFQFPELNIPANITGQMEGQAREYYKHPLGTYLGFVGKTLFKFRNREGKSCEATELGAIHHNTSVQFWNYKFLGSPANPVGEVIITPELVLPERPIAECYFPLTIMNDPKQLWAHLKRFAAWKIPGHPNYDIVAPSPNNPANKILNIRAFAAYQGLPVKYTLVQGAGKDGKEGSIYIDGEPEILSFDKRIPIDKLKQFYEIVEAKFEEEKKKREATNQQTYTRDETPETDFNNMSDNDLLDQFTSLP